jgi:hypothetical protein
LEREEMGEKSGENPTGGHSQTVLSAFMKKSIAKAEKIGYTKACSRKNRQGTVLKRSV